VVSAVPGQSVTYTIVVSNAGPSDVVNAAVADTFNPALFNVAGVSWTCAVTGSEPAERPRVPAISRPP